MDRNASSSRLSSSSSTKISVAPPTQLVLGSAAEVDAARQNFEEREQASKSFRTFLPFRKTKATPLARRAHSEEPEDESTSPVRCASDTGLPVDINSPSSPTGSRFLSVKLDDFTDHDRNAETKELARWAFVYENQRGCVVNGYISIWLINNYLKKGHCGSEHSSSHQRLCSPSTHPPSRLCIRT